MQQLQGQITRLQSELTTSNQQQGTQITQQIRALTTQMDALRREHASEMAKLQNQHKRQLDTAQTNLATKESGVRTSKR